MQKHAFYRRGFVISLLLASVVFLPTTAFAVVDNVTPFEWTMPDRLLMNPAITDVNVPQYDPAVEIIPADGWTVNFDACGVSTSTLTSYQWSVDGVVVATVTACEFSHQFPEEGSYHVALTVIDNVGDTAVIEETVTVQDWLIIAMGDSYGSGEGNPIIPVTSQAHIDFSVLRNLATNVWTDLQDAVAQLPGLEEAQAAAQQLRDDTQAIRNEALDDLNRIRAEHQHLFEINDNVENDPVVTAARNNVYAAQNSVTYWEGQVAAAQRAYSACTGPCLLLLGELTAAQTALLTAQADLATAEAALFAARNAAILIYSTIATIQNFTDLANAIADANFLIDAANNVYNAANNAYINAQAALQQAIDAVASLTSVIDSLEQAWLEARFNALEQYLESMPTWTAVPPSWGMTEPSYKDVVMDFQIPGEAMRCHRSMYSGQARAALALEQMDPHTSVTFVHLSCSGAKITEGLINAYGAQSLFALNGLIWPDGGGLLEGQSIEEALPHLANLPEVPSQITAASDIISQNGTAPPREIDAVVISIGGNDISFAGMIESCMGGEPCHQDIEFTPSAEFTDAQREAVAQNCNPSDLINFLTGSNLQTEFFSFTDLCLSIYDSQTSTSGAAAVTFQEKVIDTTIKNIDGVDTEVTQFEDKFISLKVALEERLPQLATNSHRVYFTEYPNPTGTVGGAYCGWEPGQESTVGEEIKNLPGVTQPEIIWADSTVAAALRDETNRFVTERGWKFISSRGIDGDTIGTASKSHGYCADDHWVVRIPESLITQADHLGAVHPNIAGHENYAVAIFEQLRADLYPNGANQPPRPPEEPTEDTPVSNNPGPTPGGGGGGGGSISPLMLLLLVISTLVMRKTGRRS